MTDHDIRNAVLAALEADPEVDGSAIGVTVHGGVATLTGRLGSFAEKAAATRVALRAEGVRGVASEIEVCGEQESYVPDEVIARQVADFLRDAPGLRSVNVRVAVTHGSVTLSGAVERDDQRALVRGFAQGLEGVERVHDSLTLRGAAAE